MNKEETTTEKQEQKYIPVVNQISVLLSSEVGPFEDDWEDFTKGEIMETILTDVCLALGEVGKLTHNAVDVEFCLSLVATYMAAKDQGTLDGTESRPSELFDENIFKNLEDETVSTDTV